MWLSSLYMIGRKIARGFDGKIEIIHKCGKIEDTKKRMPAAAVLQRANISVRLKFLFHLFQFLLKLLEGFLKGRTQGGDGG